MSHLDDDQLALLALGEPVASSTETAHLRDCADCAAELAQMTRTVQIARTTIDPGTLEAPPDRVWTDIAQELGLTASAPTGKTSSGTDGESRRPRSRRVIAWVLAAALVVLAGAGIATWAVVARLAPEAIAVATLDPFPDHDGARGTADVQQDSDGSRRLIVTLENDDIPDTYREVWLIRNDAGALISLGVLEGSDGSFMIPDGVDLDEYGLVDISVEALDGDPAHSGDSIVRGQLRAT